MKRRKLLIGTSIGCAVLLAGAALYVGCATSMSKAREDPRVSAQIRLANDWAMATAAANKVADQSPADEDTAFELMPNYDNNLPDPDIEVGIWDRETGVFTPYDVDAPPPPPDPFGPPLSNFSNAPRVLPCQMTTSPNEPLSLLFGPIVGTDTAEVD